jgi:hypothetical protein
MSLLLRTHRWNGHQEQLNSHHQPGLHYDHDWQTRDMHRCACGDRCRDERGRCRASDPAIFKAVPPCGTNGDGVGKVGCGCEGNGVKQSDAEQRPEARCGEIAVRGHRRGDADSAKVRRRAFVASANRPANGADMRRAAVAQPNRRPICSAVSPRLSISAGRNGEETPKAAYKVANKRMSAASGAMVITAAVAALALICRGSDRCSPRPFVGP